MAPTMSSLFFFLCAFVTLILFPFAAPNSDEDALIAFKNSLTDPENFLQSWDPTLFDPCTWLRIDCDDSNRVTRVNLGSSNLSGNLVPELGNLPSLQYLELFGNNLQGTIPPELGNLNSLISLDLYENNLSGNIPPSLGNLKNAKFIRLNSNHLTGQVPESLKNLPNIVVFNVSNNNLINSYY